MSKQQGETQNNSCKSLRDTFYKISRKSLRLSMPNNSMFIKAVQSHLKIQVLEEKYEKQLQCHLKLFHKHPQLHSLPATFLQNAGDNTMTIAAVNKT